MLGGIVALAAIARFVTLDAQSFWQDEAAIRRFAGTELLKAKYYDFDADFLLELEPEVTHFEVLD